MPHAAASWTAIPAAIAGMDALSQALAATFLRLGKELEWFVSESREIASLARHVTEGLQQEDADQLATAFRALVAGIEEVTHVSKCSQTGFQRVLHELRSVEDGVQRLKRRTSLMRSLSILCHIEQQQLERAAASEIHLARDVEQIASRIRGHAEKIASTRIELVQCVLEGSKQLQTVSLHQDAGMDEIQVRIDNLLRDLEVRARRAQTSSEFIAQQYSDARNALEATVMSLQSEDIARQQIEHVQAALGQALAATNDSRRCGSILHLQQAQLECARAHIAQATEHIAASLSAASARISGLVEAATTLHSEMTQSGSAANHVMEQQVSGLSAISREVSGASAAVYTVLRKTIPAFDEMTKHVTALKGVDQVVRGTALNTFVETAQLGARGSAMQVISTEIRRVSSESGSDIAHIENVLHRVTAEIRAIPVDPTRLHAEYTSDAATAVEAHTKLHRLSKSLEEGNLMAMQNLQSMVSKSRELVRRIQTTCASLDHGRCFESLFLDPITTLQTMLKNDAADPRSAADHRAQEFAADLSGSYSMAMERMVHQQAMSMQSATCSTAQPSQSLNGASDAEFGDNIELF